MLLAERTPLASARPDRATLVAALAARRLDRTLTTTLPAVDPADDQAVGATAIPGFDARLGGFPRGQLSEIVGARSSGRTSLLLQLAAAATARGELVALVDALDRFDPASAVSAGVDLTRLLWIRGHVVAHPGPARDANLKAMEQAVKALALVLQAGNFGLVAFDVAGAPADTLRRLPFTTWLRLQRMVDAQPTVCVLVGNEPMARSAAGLTVLMENVEERSDKAKGKSEKGETHTERLFTGFDVEARVIRARARGREDVSVRLATRVAF